MNQIPKYKSKDQLSKKEKDYLANYVGSIRKGENEQLTELFIYCNNKYQMAKTHSNYVKDWEKTKRQMENQVRTNKLPKGVSPLLMQAMIVESEKIINKKLKRVRDVFKQRYGESVYDGYLGPDGKTKKIFGIFG